MENAFLSLLETADLRLGKARASDWEDMYRNVWSRPESARYMFWRLSESEAAARDRMLRTIEFQKTHDTYLVYQKQSGRAIGFAGVEEAWPGVVSEEGVCLGPDYTGRGYGTQILGCLMRYAAARYGAKRFLCSAREENAASNALIRSMGFTLVSRELKTDARDGSVYLLLRYERSL